MSVDSLRNYYRLYPEPFFQPRHNLTQSITPRETHNHNALRTWPRHHDNMSWLTQKNTKKENPNFELYPSSFMSCTLLLQHCQHNPRAFMSIAAGSRAYQFFPRQSSSWDMSRHPCVFRQIQIHNPCGFPHWVCCDLLLSIDTWNPTGYLSSRYIHRNIRLDHNIKLTSFKGQPSHGCSRLNKWAKQLVQNLMSGIDSWNTKTGWTSSRNKSSPLVIWTWPCFGGWVTLLLWQWLARIIVIFKATPVERAIPFPGNGIGPRLRFGSRSSWMCAETAQQRYPKLVGQSVANKLNRMPKRQAIVQEGKHLAAESRLSSQFVAMAKKEVQWDPW